MWFRLMCSSDSRLAHLSTPPLAFSNLATILKIVLTKRYRNLSESFQLRLLKWMTLKLDRILVRTSTSVCSFQLHDPIRPIFTFEFIDDWYWKGWVKDKRQYQYWLRLWQYSPHLVKYDLVLKLFHKRQIKAL